MRQRFAVFTVSVKSDICTARYFTLAASQRFYASRLPIRHSPHYTSEHGTQSRHRLSVKALGLGKLNSVRTLKDSPQVRGLINQLHYLVKVED